MQFLLKKRLDSTGTSSGGGHFAIAARADAGALDSQGFVHDRASSSDVLEVGDCATAGGSLGGGRQSSQRSRRSFLEEGTHCLALAKERLHGV